MSADFNGVTPAGAFIEAAITPYNAGDWTMGCWANLRTGGAANSGRLIYICQSGTGTSIQELRVSGGVNNNVFASQKYATTVAISANVAGSLTYNSWNLICATCVDSTLTIDIAMGSLTSVMAFNHAAGQTVGAGARSTNGLDMFVGNNFANDRTADGVIAMPFMVPWVMTLTEMEHLRNGDMSVLYKGGSQPLFVWPLEGTLAYDMSGNGVVGANTSVTLGANPPLLLGYGDDLYSVASPATTPPAPTLTLYTGMTA